MAYLGSVRVSAHHPGALIKTHGPLALLAALVTTSIMLLSWWLPPPLVMPAFGVVALLSANLWALIAWCCKAERDGPGITHWDAAGVLVLLGCAAMIFSDAEQTLKLVR